MLAQNPAYRPTSNSLSHPGIPAADVRRLPRARNDEILADIKVGVPAIDNLICWIGLLISDFVGRGIDSMAPGVRSVELKSVPKFPVHTNYCSIEACIYVRKWRVD